jgi:hypothetical protein
MLFWFAMATAAVVSYCWMAGGHRFNRDVWNDPIGV